MLAHLHIQNFALIDEVKLNFKNGFTTLTGETGSGKSIILGALDLVLGERADFSSIGIKSDKAIVEAEFNLANYNVLPFFEENDLDFSNNTLIRREITKQGRSRAFINDSPVQLSVLKSLTERLIHIHSQHNTLEIRNADFQIDMVDVIGGLEKEKQNYLQIFNSSIKLKQELKKLVDELSEFNKERDYHSFLLEELNDLQLVNRNYESLEEELKRNENVDELKSLLTAVNDAIEGDEGSSIVLRKLNSLLEKSKGINSNIDEMSARLRSVLIELEDISSDATEFIDKIEVNPERLAELTILLDGYNRLLRKHNFLKQEQLLAYENELMLKLDNTTSLEEKIDEKSLEFDKLMSDLKSKALMLHENRKKASESIEKQVVELLSELKMPDSKFVIDFKLKDDFSKNGLSEVKFLFTSNNGVAPVSIEKAASGGELSRLMLVLQKLISVKKQLPTIIFDEIDTGVSGDVAQKIGSLLKRMGENSQLLAITHLPQVAGKANDHFKVSKIDVDGNTQTKVEVLTYDERVEEVARLMSGEKITEAALVNARVLIEA